MTHLMGGWGELAVLVFSFFFFSKIYHSKHSDCSSFMYGTCSRQGVCSSTEGYLCTWQRQELGWVWSRHRGRKRVRGKPLVLCLGIFETVFQWFGTHQVSQTNWTTSQHDLLSLPSKHWGYGYVATTMPSFVCGFWESNSCSHVCIANILSIELSFQYSYCSCKSKLYLKHIQAHLSSICEFLQGKWTQNVKSHPSLFIWKMQPPLQFQVAL